MSEAQEQKYQRHTRLRDFGAYKADVSILSTYKMAAIQENEKHVSSDEHIIPQSSRKKTRPVRAYTLTAVENLSFSSLSTDVAEGKVRFSEIERADTTDQRGNASILPFPGASTLPVEDLRGDEERHASPGPVAIKQVKRKKQLSLVLRVAVTVLLFFFLLKSFSWSTMLQALTHVQYGKMLLGVIVGAFGIVISSYQWRSLLRSEHIDYDLAELIDLYLVGIAFSHFLPTGMGGDVVKAIQVGKKSSNSAGSASAVLMSRITGFLGMLLVAFPVMVLRSKQFNSTIVLWFCVLSLLVGGMLGGAMGAAVVLPRMLKGKWLHNRFIDRFLAPVMKIGNALKATTKRPFALLIAVLYGAEFWVVGCLNYYAYGIALGVHAPLYFYFVAIPFVSLITFLPISINGFGLREGAFVYILSTIHVSSASALLLALFMDAQVLLLGVLGGSIYLRMGGKHASTRQVRRQEVA